MPTVTQALRELKLKSSADLVFANGRGKVDNHSNIVQRIYHPAQIAAGVTSPVLDEAGKPTRDEDGKAIVKAKYSGLHTLRHFFASWSLGRKEDGGRGLPLNNVKHIMGHASIQMTGDRYGHFLPSQNDDDLVAADKNLFAKS
jgi:integrase